ncbi:MAG TPA: hypothetical protein PLL33_12410, partial [Paracoccus sp. (in: a-proteobacteria)]|nr:hypothetical protein [Paracoccus sp. (in: a-proteobacteria)]
GQVASLLGAEGANILKVSHSRLFLDIPAKGVSIDVTIETRGAAHGQAIEEKLVHHGFTLRRLPPQDLGDGDLS